VTLLGLLREYRVPITFGSDAHKPEEVGADFDHAAAARTDSRGTPSYTALVESGMVARARTVIRALGPAWRVKAEIIYNPAAGEDAGRPSGPPSSEAWHEEAWTPTCIPLSTPGMPPRLALRVTREAQT